MKRTILPLRSGWLFALGPCEPDPADFRPVTIPHDWCISGTVTPEAPLNVQQAWLDRKQVGWYRLSFPLKEIPRDASVMLDFGGVFECSTVWVNGTECGGHHYGYTPFRLDVTDAVREGENSLLVRVDNTREPADRWYSGCGIYRPVSLMIADRVHLDSRRLVLRYDWDSADVRLTVDPGLDADVSAVLKDANGTAVATGAGAKPVLFVRSPERWSAETPVLYTLELSLANGDGLSVRIGFRSFRVDAGTGLTVNGAPVKLRGVCLHQDMGCLGIASTREMWRDRLMKLKAMGCNALRLAHHMHSAEMLDLCDELGFYVYEECFDKWHSGLYGRYFETDWHQDVDAMLQRDRNRPCILFWGVGNEVEIQGQEPMLRTLEMLTGYVRSVDPTRPVGYAMNPHFKRPGKKIDFSRVMDIQKLVDESDDQEINDPEERIERIAGVARYVDLICCNYQEQWYEGIHRRCPDKAILCTEAYQSFVGHYHAMQNYGGIMPPLVQDTLDYVIGSFVWAGYDYLGESMGWPSKGWTGSIIRTDGSERCSYWILKSHWVKEPMLKLFLYDDLLDDEFAKPHWACPPYEALWDFPQKHQGVLPYLVATNCEHVELYVNGRQFFAPDPDTCANGVITGYMPWLEGQIEARGFIGGECVCYEQLKTPGKAAQLVMSLPYGRCPAEGEQAMVRMETADAEGTRTWRTTGTVRFTVSGDAELLATDNGDLMEHTPYTSDTLPLWHGAASCVIRRTGSGAASVTAVALIGGNELTQTFAL